MLADALATARDALSLLLRRPLAATLPLLALTLLIGQGSGYAYLTLSHLPLPWQLTLTAWLSAIGVAAAFAVGTLVASALKGLPRGRYLAGIRRLLELWLTHSAWLTLPSLLLGGIAALLGQAMGGPISEYATLRLSHPWATPPALEVATGIALYSIVLTVTATWLWPAAALMQSETPARRARPPARRMLQRIAPVEWLMVLTVLLATLLAILVPAATPAVGLLAVLLPAMTVCAVQRSHAAFRHAEVGSLPRVRR